MLGAGGGLNSTTSMAIIASHYKNEREKMLGMMESASGVGLLMGPGLGALLYHFGGYSAPFFAVAGCYFAMYPLISYTLVKIN